MFCLISGSFLQFYGCGINNRRFPDMTGALLSCKFTLYITDSDMFDICLIQPPIEDFYRTAIRNIPLGLLSLGASLKDAHIVRLLDLRRGKPRRMEIPEELRDVKKYYRSEDASPFALYKHFSRFGLRSEDIAAAIPAHCGIFLISALFSTYIYEALEIVEIIRHKNSKAIIIAGGSGAMFHAELFFLAGCNFVIRGEGEAACKRLMDELERSSPDFSSIPNLIWQKGGKVVENSIETIENIDELSFADYSIPGTPIYMLKKKKHAMIMASRGCAHRCHFCCIHHVFGRKYRLRSPENILKEMEEKTAHGFRSFDFEDDHFGGNRQWLNELLDGIIERFSQYNLSLQAMNGITASNLDENILVKMKKAGFEGLNLSLVTPDRIRQKSLKRPFDTRHFVRIVRGAAKIGLKVTAYLIIGLPGDIPEDNLESILFLADLPVLIGPSLYYLTPGTADFEEFIKETPEMISPRCFRSGYFPYERREFSRTAAMTLFRICRIINFIKAVETYHYQASDYTLFKNAIELPDKLSGRQNQITIGFALLELLNKTGVIYGTGKKQGHQYPIIQEIFDDDIVRRFLENYNFRING